MKKLFITFIVFLFVGIMLVLLLFGFLLWFMSPAAIQCTSNVEQYTVFNEYVNKQLEAEKYYLPTRQQIITFEDIQYAFYYKPEDLQLPQFYIHLIIADENTDRLETFICEIEQNTDYHYQDGDDEIWISQTTAKSIQNRKDPHVYDGMKLFFYIAMRYAADNRLEFWVCQIQDAGEIIFDEFGAAFDRLCSLTE